MSVKTWCVIISTSHSGEARKKGTFFHTLALIGLEKSCLLFTPSSTLKPLYIRDALIPPREYSTSLKGFSHSEDAGGMFFLKVGLFNYSTMQKPPKRLPFHQVLLEPCFMYLGKGNINVICIVATWWAKSHAPYCLRGCVTIEPIDIHVTLGISSEPADCTEMTSSHLIVPSAKWSPTSVETNGSLP